MIIFDFDSLEIKKLKANGESSGDIFIRGSLPFYGKNNSDKSIISMTTNKFNLNLCIARE